MMWQGLSNEERHKVLRLMLEASRAFILKLDIGKKIFFLPRLDELEQNFLRISSQSHEIHLYDLALQLNELGEDLRA
jgi:hypothetical protein